MTGTELLILAVALAAVTALVAAVAALRRTCAVLRRRVEHDSQELQRLQLSFARFAPPVLVERIASDGVVAGGDRRDVTVMFADIRGFTQLSEKLDPGVVIEMLDGYFGEMSGVIRSHHGHVTRIMGDGIMSVFGALERNPWQVQDAVEAAVEMRAALGRYNAKLRELGRPELRFGIGIHCGSAVAGLLGGAGLLEFTVIGDAVNVAARVEALTRDLERDILVTEDVRGHLDGRFRMDPMPALPIKGKAHPIATWAVLD